MLKHDELLVTTTFSQYSSRSEASYVFSVHLCWPHHNTQLKHYQQHTTMMIIYISYIHTHIIHTWYSVTALPMNQVSALHSIPSNKLHVFTINNLINHFTFILYDDVIKRNFLTGHGV